MLGLVGVAVADDALDMSSVEARRVTLLLGGLHAAPARKMLEEVTPKARALVTAHARMQPRSLRRYAALETLAQWPDAATQSLYIERLADGTDPGGQHRAARLLGRVFGPQAVAALAGAWPKADLQLRLTLVASLRDAGAPGRAALSAFLPTETAKVVLDALHNGLVQIR